MGVEQVDFLTFIIPTIGRSTLKRAVDSLINQNDFIWKAFIIWDGIEPTINFNNEYINSIVVPKQGYAGLVRNLGINLVDTRWMAFLDDDDYLANTYIQKLKYYINEDSSRDVIIFTYKDIITNNIQPPPKIKDIKECNVGISFACKTDFIHKHNIKFPPGSIEDFAFLNSCKNFGANYYLTHDIQYYVGGIGGNNLR